MNLGSPDSTAVKDVRRYLNEFLMDERVIDLPYLWRLLLVRGIIVPFRSPKSAEAYRSIWTNEGSPLMVISRQLQEAVQDQVTMPVTIAMRYGSPTPKAAFDELLKKEPELDEAILVPLYPHYAMSSYETAVEYARELHEKHNYPFKLSIIKPYYNDEDYLEALTESIRPYLANGFDHVLFSYHGVPERHILKGDIKGTHCLSGNECCSTSSIAHTRCYRHQCLETTRIVSAQLDLPGDKLSTSFQSRLGKEEWLKPYTAVRLTELPAQGIKKLLVVCPAFVSDCLETLEEIAQEGKEIFLHAGGESYEMIPCLNTNPLWVKAITKWTELISQGDKKMLL